MKRHAREKLLDESCAWIRDHWNATNLEVPEMLLERWIYEANEDERRPEGFHLAVFAFGFMQHDLISHGVPEGIRRFYPAETLLALFGRWQLKLSLAALSRRTNLRTRALPLFAFPEHENVEAWCGFGLPPTTPPPGNANS